MPTTITLAETIRRDRQAMVRTAATLASIAAAQRAEATRPDQVMGTAVPMLQSSARAAQAAQTIRNLLLASGITHDEIMAIAEGIDREAAALAALEATG